MNKISTVLSILCLGLVGVLFYLHFTHTEKLNKVKNATVKNAGTSFKIAYFDIDSLQANYQHYKDMVEELSKLEANSKGELNTLRSSYQRFISELQQKGPGMTQAEQENAQRELQRREREYQSKEADLQNKLQSKQMDKLKELREEIETFLADYNKEKGYAYIFSYEPGMLLYFRDSALNITPDVLQGLNNKYATGKKKN